MSYDVYKEAILRVLPAAPEIPVEAPPTESFDMQNVQVCPQCGASDAIVQMVEDAEVAKCPRCQCEFPPRMESVTRKVIRRIGEHRRLRLRRLAEQLPVNSPVRGIDPTDYALFRKVVDVIEPRQIARPASGEPQYLHKQMPPQMQPAT